jgi:hypothetical protein
MTETGSTNPTDTLRQIIDDIEADVIATPGTGFVVTLYLPWGAAVGELESEWQFTRKLAGELRVVNDTAGYDHLHELGDKIDPARGVTPPHGSDEYVHLGEFTECHVNGQIYQHHHLRVRMADVTAWTCGRPQRPAEAN